MNEVPMAPRRSMKELSDERIIAKLIEHVDLSYPKMVKDKRMLLQSALAAGVLHQLLKMGEQEGLTIKETSELPMSKLMVQLIKMDTRFLGNEALQSFLKTNTVYNPEENKLNES